MDRTKAYVQYRRRQQTDHSGSEHYDMDRARRNLLADVQEDTR
jgi:hypothetical protein